MQRRSWLKLGLASAALLAVAGGTAALWQPGLQAARLSGPARGVFAALSVAILQGSLPAAGPLRSGAVAALLDRIDTLIEHLPQHAQGELSRLLSLLVSAPGRLALAGLAEPWGEAHVAGIQRGLQSMRSSSIDLRQQAYQALHDIVVGAYFADPATWGPMGYPGPRAV